MSDSEEKLFISIEPSEKSFDYWINHPFTSDEIKSSLKEANVLVVPAEGFRDYEGPVFPIGTRELFQFILKNAPEPLVIEATVDEADYKELALHGALIIIGTFVVTSVVAPIFVNLVSEYLKKRWGEKHLCKPDTQVKFELILQDKDKASKLLYEGPASTFETEVLRHLSRANPKEENKNEVIDGSNLLS